MPDKISGRSAGPSFLPNQHDVIYEADSMNDAQLDVLPFGMMQLDEAGVILRYSTPESRLSGLTADECVGEGIEQVEQQAALGAIGCQLGQGYLFAKPLEPTRFEEMVEAGRGRR